MINGAHVVIFSTDAEADRAFLGDVIKLPAVDVGGGWLIFGLPPSEIAMHPGDTNDKHEIYFMCEDIDRFITEASGHGAACDPVEDQGWGRLTRMKLPGGGTVGIYEPRHERPPQVD